MSASRGRELISRTSSLSYSVWVEEVVAVAEVVAVRVAALAAVAVPPVAAARLLSSNCPPGTSRS